MSVINSLNENIMSMVTLIIKCGMLMCYSQSGYVCMVFYKRDGHVIELQQSSKYCLLSVVTLTYCIVLC